MEKLLEDIAKNLVSNPEEVKVVSEENENGDIILNLYVNEEDLGRIIGKNGKIAKNIRNILRAISQRKEKEYYLKIVEPNNEN